MSNITQRMNVNPEPSTMQAARLAGRREQIGAQQRATTNLVWCPLCGKSLKRRDDGLIRRHQDGRGDGFGGDCPMSGEHP